MSHSKFSPTPEILSLNGKKYRVVACVLRQPTVGGGWALINDALHAPINVASVTNDATKITITYSFTAKKVGSLVATPDEAYAQSGYTFGASVDVHSSDIYIAATNTPVAAYVNYNGSAWSVSSDQGGVSFGSFDAGGNLRLNHNSMGGTGPISAVAINSPYLVKIVADATAFTTVQFTNYAGTVITTPDAGMALYLYRQPRIQSVNPQNLKNDSGNIWVYGIFEV